MEDEEATDCQILRASQMRWTHHAATATGRRVFVEPFVELLVVATPADALLVVWPKDDIPRSGRDLYQYKINK